MTRGNTLSVRLRLLLRAMPLVLLIAARPPGAPAQEVPSQTLAITGASPLAGIELYDLGQQYVPDISEGRGTATLDDGGTLLLSVRRRHNSRKGLSTFRLRSIGDVAGGATVGRARLSGTFVTTGLGDSETIVRIRILYRSQYPKTRVRVLSPYQVAYASRSGQPGASPSVQSIRFGTPVCSSTGPGSLDGPLIYDWRGTKVVRPVDCASSSNYMRLWLQMNVTGAEIDHYEWSITGWENTGQYGTLAYYDSVVNIDLVHGVYRVRSSGNSIRYDSPSAGTMNALTQPFYLVVEGTAWTRDYKWTTAQFFIDLHPAEKQPAWSAPAVVIQDGHAPSLSPDGTMIAFARRSDADQNWELYGAKSDGTGVTRLTYTSAQEVYSTWSPDGNAIAYTRTNDSSKVTGDLWRMNPDGTGQTETWPLGDLYSLSFLAGFGDVVFGKWSEATVNLTFNWPSVNGSSEIIPYGRYPSCAPSSKNIAFVWLGGIYTYDPTAGEGVKTVIEGAVYFEQACWSPDETKLAAYGTGGTGGSYEGLYVIDVATGAAQKVHSGQASFPSWRGSRIYFIRTVDFTSTIYMTEFR